VRMVKVQLQQAADAAAKYAIDGLPGGTQTAKNNAVAAAADNTADGTSVVVNPNADVEFGTWDGQNFTVLTGAAQSQANAVRVTARRTAANGNAVPLFFAKVIGQSTCDVTATSIAAASQTTPSGFVGLSKVEFKNNTFVGSYDSSVTTNPTQAGASDNALLGSNGGIKGGNNAVLRGNVDLGPKGNLDSVSVSGSTSTASTDLSVPSLPSWSPGVNPGGVSQSYSVSSSVVLPGGSYWFTSLTVDGTLSFSGPTTLYINGNADVSGTLMPADKLPADLRIYQYGSHNFGDDTANNTTLIADVIAPGSALSAKNNLTFLGRAIFDQIKTQNNATFFYDTSLPPLSGEGSAVVH